MMHSACHRFSSCVHYYAKVYTCYRLCLQFRSLSVDGSGVVQLYLQVQNVTHSHKMSQNLRYLHVSDLQVLLIILILKSHFYSNKCGCDVFLKVACVAEAILRKSALKFSLCIE